MWNDQKSLKKTNQPKTGKKKVLEAAATQTHSESEVTKT